MHTNTHNFLSTLFFSLHESGVWERNTFTNQQTNKINTTIFFSLCVVQTSNKINQFELCKIKIRIEMMLVISSCFQLIGLILFLFLLTFTWQRFILMLVCSLFTRIHCYLNELVCILFRFPVFFVLEFFFSFSFCFALILIQNGFT